MYKRQLLYWQVTHQAAVKSTNTGWPEASSWSTRPASQACHGPLAAVVWSLTLRGRSRAVIASVLVLCTALLGATLGRNILQGAPPPAVVAASGERWQPWSSARAAELVAQGRPVFIDFTAAWCVTCQYNKKTTLADAEVLAAFDTKQVALLRADWTRRDPAITAALAQLGRSGVPVYVLQAPGKAPQILTEILSREELDQALATL